MAHAEPAHLVFLDETSTPTTLTPQRGRALRGQRVMGRGPRSRWEAVTLVATLTLAGFGPGLQLMGALDRAAFDLFVTTLLAPTLHRGDIVVLDNLSVHKSAVAQRAIEAAGASLLFLPAYSPDFQPH